MDFIINYFFSFITMFQQYIKNINPLIIQSHPILKHLFPTPAPVPNQNPLSAPERGREEDLSMAEQIEEFSGSAIDVFEQRELIANIYKKIEDAGNGICWRENINKSERNTAETVYYAVSAVNYSESLYQDLEIFENFERQNDAPTLFDKINYTSTHFGEHLLKKVLQNPVHDMETLVKRRAILQKCAKNAELFEQIRGKVATLAAEQRNILWFYKETDDYRRNIYDMIYFQYPYIDFINHRLNKNSTFLQLLQVYKIFLTPLLTILTPIFSILIPIMVWKFTGSKIPFVLLCKLLFQFVFKTMWSTDSMKTMLFTVVSIGIWLFFYFQTLYSQIIIAKQTYQIIKIIHERMHSLYKWTKTIEELRDICQAAEIDFDWLAPCVLGDGKASATLHQSIADLKQIMEFPVLRDKHKLFNHKGLIVSQYYTFLKNRDKMDSLLYFFGQMDVLQSILTLASRHKYSFAKWVSATPDSKPVLKIKKMWHPYLTDSKTVANSLKMKKENLWLITGPNAAGKSTFIKSTMCNILFAQTICVAPCKEITITPYHNLFTYLHIPDVKGKQSLFQAEMMRNKEFLEELDRGEQMNQYSFIIMDELFSSTNYEEGVSAAYSILKKMSTMRNSKGLTTSHFYELMKLEKDTNKGIRNYYFDVSVGGEEGNQNPKKKIEYTYKIKKGFTKRRIAIDLLQQENFDPEIIENALKIFEQMAKKWV